MNDTHTLVLVFYILLVLAYTILAFVKQEGKPTQFRNTIFVFVLVCIPPLVFLFSLLKLYVYFKEPKVK